MEGELSPQREKVVNRNTYKRRLRRIRAKVSNKSETFTILHSNIRGYSSKSISLQAIAGCKMPTVLTLNETMLLSNKELNLKVVIALLPTEQVQVVEE